MADGSNTRVVVLFPGALGDLLLVMPALAGLRRRHAGAQLTLAVARTLRELATASGVADAVVSLDDADAAGLFAGARMPAWFGDRPRLYAWLGSRDAALRARLRAMTAGAAFHAVVRDDGPDHAAAAYAEQVGLPSDVAPPRWAVPPATPRLEALLAGLPRPVLAVHPGAGSPRKRWALEGFREIARRWVARGGGVCELVGPADEALTLGTGVARIVEWPLPEVMALLARVDVYVGNDSGITHLAAAAGTRGVAVFGPTPARRWAPLGAAIVALEVGGAGSSGIGLDLLGPGRVWDALGCHGCLDNLRGRA